MVTSIKSMTKLIQTSIYQYLNIDIFTGVVFNPANVVMATIVEEPKQIQKEQPKKQERHIYTEKVDVDSLQIILNNFEEIYKTYKHDVEEDDLQGMKTLLRDYYNSLNSDGQKSVEYKQKRNCNGRKWTQTVGLTNLSKFIRHTIGHEYHIDIDMVNAHPRLLLDRLRSMDYEETEYLQQYVFNRDEIIREYEKQGLDRETIKTEFLRILNGGKRTLQGDIVEGFEREVKNIHEYIMDEYPRLRNRAIRKCKKINSKNIGGTCINFLMCELENDALDRMIEVLNSKNIVITTLAYDGLTIERNDFNVINIQQIMTDCMTYVRQTYPLFELKMKEMNEIIDLTPYRNKQKYQPIPVKSVNVRFDGFIPQSVYSSLLDDCNVLFDTRQMGCGKTTSIINYGRTKKSQLIITNRISTIEQISHLNPHLQSYRNLKTDKSPDFLITCLNSLHKHFMDGKSIHDYECIAIDEICSVLKQTDMKQCEDATLELLDILKYYEGKLILMDANLDDECIDFIKSFRPNGRYNVLGGCTKNTDMKMSINKVIPRHMKHSIFLEELPFTNRKSIISSNMDIYTSNEMIIEYLKDKRPECNILHINKDTRQTTDLSTEHLQQYDYIVVSPTISEGVSFDDDVFSEYDFYGFFSNLSTDSDTGVQMTRRWRKIKNYYITIGERDHTQKYKTDDEYYEYINNPLTKTLHTYLTKVVVYNPTLRRSRFQVVRDDFFRIHSRNQIKKEYQRQHFYTSFVQGCVNNGFNIIEELYEGLRSDFVVVPGVGEFSNMTPILEGCVKKHYEEVCNSVLLTDEQVGRIDKNRCSTEQSLQLKKYYIHKTLNPGECKELTPDEYKEYDGYEKKKPINLLKRLFQFTRENGEITQIPTKEIIDELQKSLYDGLRLNTTFNDQKRILRKDILRLTNLYGFLTKLGIDNIPQVIDEEIFTKKFNEFYVSFTYSEYLKLCKELMTTPEKFKTEKEFDTSIDTAQKCITMINNLISTVIPINIEKGDGFYYLKMTIRGFSLSDDDKFRLTDGIVLDEGVLQDRKYDLFFNGLKRVFCEFCNKDYEHTYYHLTHIHTDFHKKNTKPKKEKVVYRCEKCDKDFDNRKVDYTRHINKKKSCVSNCV